MPKKSSHRYEAVGKVEEGERVTKEFPHIKLIGSKELPSSQPSFFQLVKKYNSILITCGINLSALHLFCLLLYLSAYLGKWGGTSGFQFRIIIIIIKVPFSAAKLIRNSQESKTELNHCVVCR